MGLYTAPGSAVALTVLLGLVTTGLSQGEDILYFTTWTGNGENLMPHMNAIKEQAEGCHKNRLVLDSGTMEHLKKSGVVEGSRVVMELDTAVFTKAKEQITLKNPRLAEQVDRLYDNLQGAYEDFRGNNFYASASDILRYVAFTAYSDQADRLVYHDADVRFKPLDHEQQTNLESGADMKVAMVTSTKRKDQSLVDQLSFVEPSYFYELTPYEYPQYTQFNSDLIFMRKSAATRSAVAIGAMQHKTIAASQRSIVERVLGTEKTTMTLHDAIRTTHPDETRFVLPPETFGLLYGQRTQGLAEYTTASLKRAYVAAVGLNPLDMLLAREMNAKYTAARASSEYVVDGESYFRIEPSIFLRTLQMKGDITTRKMFLSESALNPADVGAVSRQDARNWFGVSQGDCPDVPVYSMAEEAAIKVSDVTPLHVRPASPELPEGEINIDMGSLSFGSKREPLIVNPETEPEAFERGIAACGINSKRRRRAASRCSLYEEENFSTTHNGEFLFKDKWHVKFTREDGSLRMIVESTVNARNVISRVVTKIPAALVKAFVQKRKAIVEMGRVQLEKIMGNPEVEVAMNFMMSEAHSAIIPSDHGRAVKRMGSAYARMATSGPKSQLAVKAWVLGARAYGVFTNIGALVYGDPLAKTFAALDLSQTVNGFMAHKLSQYAKTKALAETLELLANNPVMNMAGTAANIFFFAQNVRNVADGHHSPTDYYWLTRSSMQMLTLMFESLNPAMLPMVSVDVLVTLITQGEYAKHMTWSVANKLPLSTKDMWTLGATSFFGSRSWLEYYEKVADLERVNSQFANSLVDALRTVNVVVGFPLSTVINEWHNQHSQECVETSVEVWPVMGDSTKHDLSQADFSMEHGVPLKEVYIGNMETQQLCYNLAVRNCLHLQQSVFHRAMVYLGQNIGALPTNEECVFYDQSIPNATDPCGNLAKFVDDTTERQRLVPVTTEHGDPLMEPQLRAVSVNAYEAKMISRPVGWMKESRKCTALMNVKDRRSPFLTARARDANIFKAHNCSCLRQCITRRYIATDKDEDVVQPYVFRKRGPESQELVLYANAPIVKKPRRKHLKVEDINRYYKPLVAKADMPAIIVVDGGGVYKGATNAANIFLVSQHATAATKGGLGVDTVIIGNPEKRLSIAIMRDEKKSKIRGSDITLVPISIESIKAEKSSANAVLEQRMDLHLGAKCRVVLCKGSEFSTLELGPLSTVIVKAPMTLTLVVAYDTMGVEVSATVDVDDITLVLRPATSLLPRPDYVKRACSVTDDGLSLHGGAVLFKKGSSAVSIDPDGIMLTCSVTGDMVYRSAYKNLSTKEGEEFNAQVWREKLDALVRAGLDDMTVTNPTGVRVVATRAKRTVLRIDNTTTSIHQSFGQQRSIAMDLVVDLDVTHCDLSLYGSGSPITYCCMGSDCFPMGARDVTHCDIVMTGVTPDGSNYTTQVTVTAKGFGIVAVKGRESGRYETPEGLELHSSLHDVNTVRMVLSEDVTVVFRDQFSGMERVIPAHYGEVFLKRTYDDEDLLIHGVEMMTPSW